MVEAQRAGYSATRLERLAQRLARAHPTMASVWNAVHAPDPRAFANSLHKNTRATIRATRRLLRRGSTVLTLSYSSTVLEALSRHDLHVVVAESLPGGEGATTARSLRRRGVDARCVPDATLGTVVWQVDCAMVGADAVTNEVVINKVGTRLLALACQDAAIPCYVLADPSKMAPPDWPAPDLERHALFEATPRRLVTAIVTSRR